MEGGACNQLTEEMRNKYIKINCGGTLYFTTIDTLTKRNDTMLSSMFSGRIKFEVDPEGWILIDRCGKHFGSILNYLRDGTVPLPKCSKEIAELMAEAKYYCISDLTKLCELSLFEEYKHKCQIPLVSVQEDLELIITLSLKPIIVLTINSEDEMFNARNYENSFNILKNIALLEKLTLQYSDQILFIKKVGMFVDCEDVCHWSVYKGGNKIEVINFTGRNSTQMYANIKIHYNEARIYEAVLKAMSLASNKAEKSFLASIVKFFKSNSHIFHCFSYGVLICFILKPIVKNNLYYRF